MSPQAQFEEFLKRSDHFADALNTHRRATAAIVAGLVTAMTPEAQRNALAVLKRLEESTGSISDDGSRRVLCQMIQEAIRSQ